QALRELGDEVRDLALVRQRLDAVTVRAHRWRELREGQAGGVQLCLHRLQLLEDRRDSRQERVGFLEREEAGPLGRAISVLAHHPPPPGHWGSLGAADLPRIRESSPGFFGGFAAASRRLRKSGAIRLRSATTRRAP